jgi:hypothetical protein
MCIGSTVLHTLELQKTSSCVCFSLTTSSISREMVDMFGTSICQSMIQRSKFCNDQGLIS